MSLEVDCNQIPEKDDWKERTESQTQSEVDHEFWVHGVTFAICVLWLLKFYLHMIWGDLAFLFGVFTRFDV